MHHTDLAFCQK